MDGFLEILFLAAVECCIEILEMVIAILLCFWGFVTAWAIFKKEGDNE